MIFIQINEELKDYNRGAGFPSADHRCQQDRRDLFRGRGSRRKDPRWSLSPRASKYFPSPQSAAKDVKELLSYIWEVLEELRQEPVVFEQEYFPGDYNSNDNLSYTVEQLDEHTFVVEGPKIEKMLGYTNLDSEKGFLFFQNFLKNTGILEDLEAAGIQDGDTVRMYGLQFDYYKE
ncbi:MAG: Obg family GTPase CgtA [Lachnospiraceae bacterium]